MAVEITMTFIIINWLRSADPGGRYPEAPSNLYQWSIFKDQMYECYSNVLDMMHTQLVLRNSILLWLYLQRLKVHVPHQKPEYYPLGLLVCTITKKNISYFEMNTLHSLLSSKFIMTSLQLKFEQFWFFHFEGGHII